MSIDPTDEPPCPDDEVRKQYPEVATTPEWREKMAKTRKARKDENGKPMTQEALGKLIGTSQNVISEMEKGIARGGIDSSKYVLPVCHALDIGPPVHFGSETFKAWVDLGYRVEMKSEKQLEAMLSVFKTMLGQANENGSK
jgi:transcriptional regulator with XRE-family HTH domain